MGSKCPFCRDGENALSEGIPVTQPLGIPHGIGRDRRVVTAAEKKSFKTARVPSPNVFIKILRSQMNFCWTHDGQLD